MGNLIKEDTLKKFQKFNSVELPGQRDLITKPEGISYINMLFDIISNCGSDNYLLMYIIPTIDGIILGKQITFRGDRSFSVFNSSID